MPKKRKKTNKTLKNKLNCEMTNMFDMNNGPEEISSKNNKTKFNKRSCK